MAWIKLHQGVNDHRKTLQASQLLGVDPDLIVGKLARFWTWALDQADDDGRLPDLTAEQLGRMAGWTRKPATFIDAITRVGFIDEEDGGRYLHDWADYAGRLNEKRTKDKERQQLSRRTAAGRRRGVTRESQPQEREQEKELEKEIDPKDRSESENARALPDGFAYKLDPPEPDEPGFVGEFVRHYEQAKGKYPPHSQVADARQLERDFGAAVCIQEFADSDWEYAPRWIRKRLEDPNHGRPNTPARANGRGARGAADPDDPTGVAGWEAALAKRDETRRALEGHTG